MTLSKALWGLKPCVDFYVGVAENRGTLFWGPYNKDPPILGYNIGVPYVLDPTI